jgi:hypothetical protein
MIGKQRAIRDQHIMRARTALGEALGHLEAAEQRNDTDRICMIDGAMDAAKGLLVLRLAVDAAIATADQLLQDADAERV